MPKYLFVISGFLAIFAWNAVHHYAPWPAFYNESIFILGFLPLSVAVCRGAAQEAPIRTPLPAAVASAAILVPLFQSSLGIIDFRGDAIVSSLYLGSLALACTSGGRLADSLGPRFTEGMAVIWLIGATIALLLATHQWLLADQLGIWLADLPPGGRPYANLAQPNNLATLLCCGLAAAIYLRERGYLGSFLLALLSLLLIAGVAMTRSRMALVILVVIAMWALWSRRRLALKLSPLEIVGGLAIFCLLWGGWPTLSEWLYLYATPTEDRLATAGGDVRLILWQQLLDAAFRAPLFGYGWNQVSVAQVAVAAEYPQSVFVEHAHNIVIDLLVWNGVLIGGAIVIAAGWWLITRMRRVESVEGWFGLMFILAVLTHAMFELPLEYAYFLIPVGLCVGMVESRHPGSRSIHIPRWTFGVALSIGLVLFAWIFVEYQVIEADHRRMRYEAAGIEPRPTEPLAPNVVLLTQQREFIRFARTQAREGMTDEELEWMRKVAHRYAFPPALFRYALALGLNNRPEEAALELKRLKQLHPPERFQEAKDGWLSLAATYPQLSKVTGVF